MHDALEVKEMKCWIEKHKNKDGKKNWLGERSERESFWKDGESEGMQEKEGKKNPERWKKSSQQETAYKEIKKQEDTAVCPSETSFELSTVKNIFLIFPQ